jgi:alpha-beta hydrolase superfamily lysophospholipase
MLEDARARQGELLWVQVLDDLRKHMALNPGMRLQLVGHSMGGGCAAILTMM